MLERKCRDELKLLAKNYLAATNVALSSVSTRATKNAICLELFFSGQRSLTLHKFDNAMQWFSDNWPPDAVWPSEVERRPAKAKRAGAGKVKATPARELGT